jgi:hypothetical protein
MAMGTAFLSSLDVILSSADGLRAQDTVKFMSTWVLACPFSDGIKHLSLDLDTFIPNSWVMKSSYNIIDDFVNRHPGILPSI